MTLLAVPIPLDAPAEVPDALHAAERAAAAGARIVEWRVDRLAGEPGAGEAVEALVRQSPIPSIVTCRDEVEGGAFSGGPAARAELLGQLAAGADRPRYVDVEWHAYQREEAVRRAVGMILDRDDPGGSTGLILSSHDMTGRPADLLQRVEAMMSEPRRSVVKIVWRARSLRDNLEAFDLLSERRAPMIALCMGELGLMSRVLASKFGGLITFAAATGGAESAPGQPTIEELRGRYRFDAIGPATRVYGVIGWPVAHSLGPHVHNAGFAAVGHDGVYLPMPVPPEYEHFKATVGSLVDHPKLDFAGASVTIPHKEHLLRFVTERGGRVDADAARVGAANTLSVDADGVCACTNTDAPAALAALGAPRDGRVAVLGAGGVARAVVAGLAGAGLRVAVFNRSPARAEALVADLRGRGIGAGLTVGEPADLAGAAFGIIVNCTPVGMAGGPDPDGSPLPDGTPLDDGVTVFDTVYRPARTPLLREAEARGARIVTGLDMFVRQAALQFEAWTGRAAPLGVFAEAVARSA